VCSAKCAPGSQSNARTSDLRHCGRACTHTWSDTNDDVTTHYRYSNSDRHPTSHTNCVSVLQYIDVNALSVLALTVRRPFNVAVIPVPVVNVQWLCMKLNVIMVSVVRVSH
jgi:hypothetical protein